MNAQTTPHVLRTGAHKATMREFVAVIFRRRWLIVGLFVVVTATVVALSFTTPVTYSSSGRVLVYRGERTNALSPNRQLFNEWESDLASEQATARSEPVIDRTVQLLRERAKAVGKPVPPFKAASIDVEVMGKSNVLGIGYTDRDSAVARAVCDAMITAYVEYRQSSQLGRPESYFAVELSDLDKQIEHKLTEREAIASRSGVSSPVDQSREWSSQLGSLEQRHAETMSELAEQQSAVQAMREMQQHPDIDLPTLSIAYTNESALVDIKQKIVQQQTRIATLREKYQDDAPEVQNAMETLSTLQALLRKEVEARLTMSQTRIDMLKAKLSVEERELASIQVKLDQIPSSQRSLDDIDAEIRTLRARYDEYMKARDQAAITANTSQELTVALLNPAGPAVAQNTRDYVRLALAPAFSLVVGIGLAFFIDSLDITVRTAAQAEEYLEIPVLASLSERRSRRG